MRHQYAKGAYKAPFVFARCPRVVPFYEFTVYLTR